MRTYAIPEVFPSSAHSNVKQARDRSQGVHGARMINLLSRCRYSFCIPYTGCMEINPSFCGRISKETYRAEGGVPYDSI